MKRIRYTIRSGPKGPVLAVLSDEPVKQQPKRLTAEEAARSIAKRYGKGLAVLAD